jgi:hypothetical protein
LVEVDVDACVDDVSDVVDADFAAVEDEVEFDDDEEAEDEEEGDDEVEDDDDEEAEGDDEPDFALGADAGADSVGDADIALDINAVGVNTTMIATSVARSVYVVRRALRWFQRVWSRARISPPSTAPKRC